MSALTVVRRRHRRSGIGAVLLRRLPNDCVLGRMHIGTKVAGLAVLTIATLLNVGWWQLVAVGAVVIAAFLAAGAPWKALPRLAGWFWLAIAAGFLLALVGGRGAEFVRLLGFGFAFLLLSLIISWTTDLAEIARTLSHVGSPLRRVGIPVDEWAVTTALAVRCLPLLLEEGRIVLAARRLRPTRRELLSIPRSVVDIVAACMAAAARRADDVGVAILLRGGPRAATEGQQISRSTNRLRRIDIGALVLIVLASFLPVVFAATV